jgi:Protein of unknown function (DUF4056)
MNERTSILGRELPYTPIGGRPCCLLSTQQGLTFPVIDLLVRFLGPESVVDNHNLDHLLGAGRWDYWSRKEISGIIYTRRGGFIDLAHLRDHIDLTLDYYRLLTRTIERHRRSFSPTRSYPVTVTLLDDIPAEHQLAVAQSLAYDESIFHEIETYWGGGFLAIVDLEHKSAFSPEDLVSNFLGVVLGGRVISQLLDPASGSLDFNTAASVELAMLLDQLEAVPKDVTYDALSTVADEWFRIIPVISQLFVPNSWMPGYLRRRNFAWRPIQPWLLRTLLPEDAAEAGAVIWPENLSRELPLQMRSYYEARYAALDLDWLSSRFESEIQRVQDDARTEYDEQFQDPAPARPLDADGRLDG